MWKRVASSYINQYKHSGVQNRLPNIRTDLYLVCDISSTSCNKCFHQDIDNDKLVKRKKYIDEVVNNFIELGISNKKKNVLNSNLNELNFNLKETKKKVSLIDKKSTEKVRNSSTAHTYSNQKLQKAASKTSTDTNVSRRSQPQKSPSSTLFLLDPEEQNNINDLLNSKQENRAFEIIINNIEKEKFPNFSTFKILASWASKNGDSSKIQVIQDICKKYYPQPFQKENSFEHYLCEALFREGKTEESLTYLKCLVLKYPRNKRVKETACFIIRLLPNISEDEMNMVYEIVKLFIEVSSEFKPAVFFWEKSVRSSYNYNLGNYSTILLDEYPNLLDGEEDRMCLLVELVKNSDDVDVLYSLVEIFLKLNMKLPLSKALSALLNHFCIMENLTRANEIFDFIKSEDVLLSPCDLRNMIDLLHKKQLPTPLSILAFKYGFGIPKREKKEIPESSSVPYKF